MTNTHKTIVALATPKGMGGVAVLRLSGPESWRMADALRQGETPLNAGQVAYDWIIDPVDQKTLDEVILLPFKGPKSFTGEDIIEIQCHGGVAVAKAILNACFQQGAVAASAGEFTRRAVLNGKADLTQAEAILDLIHAEGEQLVKLAANNLQHRALGKQIEAYQAEIAAIQGDLVASIDFPDEVDEPDRAQLAGVLKQLQQTMAQQCQQSKQYQVLRTGLEVALLGKPNAGKSSLFNALLRQDRAIVTDIAGTTRDVLRETVSIKGIPVTFLDTAGLRESTDHIEQLGIARSHQAIESAQLILYLVDGSDMTGLSEEWTALKTLIEGQDKPGLVILNKADQWASSEPTSKLPWDVVTVSAKTGDGLSNIWQWLEKQLEQISPPQELEVLLSQRQLETLETIVADIDEAQQTLLSSHHPIDLATVPLTNALLCLQGLLGADTTEQVLDSVFSRFCVGK